MCVCVWGVRDREQVLIKVTNCVPYRFFKGGGGGGKLKYIKLLSKVNSTEQPLCFALSLTVFIHTDTCVSYCHHHTVQRVKSLIMSSSLSSTYQDFNTLQTYTIYIYCWNFNTLPNSLLTMYLFYH